MNRDEILKNEGNHIKTVPKGKMERKKKQ